MASSSPVLLMPLSPRLLIIVSLVRFASMTMVPCWNCRAFLISKTKWIPCKCPGICWSPPQVKLSGRTRRKTLYRIAKEIQLRSLGHCMNVRMVDCSPLQSAEPFSFLQMSLSSETTCRVKLLKLSDCSNFQTALGGHNSLLVLIC